LVLLPGHKGPRMGGSGDTHWAEVVLESGVPEVGAHKARIGGIWKSLMAVVRWFSLNIGQVSEWFLREWNLLDLCGGSIIFHSDGAWA
jgi:hypothetical protein